MMSDPRPDPSRAKLKLVAVLNPNHMHSDAVYKRMQEASQNCYLASTISRVDFNRLDWGQAELLDKVYSADVVLVDLTDKTMRPAMMHHLGVRGSFRRNQTIITLPNSEDGLKFAEKVDTYNDEWCIVQYPLEALPDSPVASHENDEDGDGDGSETADEATTDAEGTEDEQNTTISAKPLSPSDKLVVDLISVLEEFGLNQPKQEQQRVLENIRKAEKLSEEERVTVYDAIVRQLETDPGQLVTSEVIHRLCLGYRDVQGHTKLINLYETTIDLLKTNVPCPDSESSDCEEEVLESLIPLKYQYANALNRRNHGSDRTKALKVLKEEVIANSTPQVDHLCLVGRIYKDIYSDSKMQDAEALNTAIEWYRKGYNARPSTYPAVNLASLLVMSGEDISSCDELQDLNVFVRFELGKKGKIEAMKDYWDVATLFEMHLLAKKYKDALPVAAQMFRLKPPVWHFTTTLKNCSMIDSKREELQSNPRYARRHPTPKLTEEQVAQKNVFDWWVRVFRIYSGEEAFQHGDDSVEHVPVLLLEPKSTTATSLDKETVKYQPCQLSLQLFDSPDEGSFELHNISEAVSTLLSNGQHLEKGRKHKWAISPDKITRVLAKDSLQLDMVAENNDFNLFFPTETIRNVVYRLLQKHVQPVEPIEEDREISFDYIIADGGKKVLLGQGSFGKVFLATRRDGKGQIAVKQVALTRKNDLVSIRDEVRMHMHWHHEHIVDLLGFQDMKEGDKVIGIQMLMEYVPGGSLQTLLDDMWQGGIKDETILRDYFIHMLSGVQYLHSCSVVHRDLKPANVLVDRYSGCLKLIDFGLSRRQSALQSRVRGMAGTYRYMAPEVVSDVRGYSFKADIWSVGCILLAMLTGKHPHDDLVEDHQVLNRLGNNGTPPPLPSDIDKYPQVKQVLEYIFVAAETRPSAKSLLDKTRWLKRSLQDKKHRTSRKSLEGSLPLATSGEVARIKTALTDMIASKQAEILEAWIKAGMSAASEVPSARSLINQDKLEVVLRTIVHSIKSGDVNRDDKYMDLVGELTTTARPLLREYLESLPRVVILFCRNKAFEPHWLFEVSRFLEKAVADCTVELEVAIVSDQKEKKQKKEQKKKEKELKEQRNIQRHRKQIRALAEEDYFEGFEPKTPRGSGDLAAATNEASSITVKFLEPGKEAEMAKQHPSGILKQGLTEEVTAEMIPEAVPVVSSPLMEQVLTAMLSQLQSMRTSPQLQRTNLSVDGDLTPELLGLLNGAGLASNDVRSVLLQHSILDEETFLMLENDDLRELFPVMGTRLKMRSLIRDARTQLD
eukprot:m.256527 g.256527  ORF g.256527 m.256527 type:complete len:1296 (+) comp17570_c0_seq5:41-3928(+)